MGERQLFRSRAIISHMIFAHSILTWRLHIGVHRTESLGASWWNGYVDEKPQMMMMITPTPLCWGA